MIAVISVTADWRIRMKIKSRNIALATVFMLVLVVQLIFAGKGQSTDNGVKAPVSAEVETEGTQSEDGGLVFEEEIVSAELNVVYRSPLTAGDFDKGPNKEVSVSDYANKIVSYTVSRLCIYESPDLKSKVVGVMYSGSEADVLEIGEDWTKITSGGVTGYVRNIAVLFGEEAEIIAGTIGKKVTIASVDEVVVYEDASVGSDKITTFPKGTVLTTMDDFGNFVMVDTDAGFGYVLKSQTEVSYGLDEAITIEKDEEEQAKRKAEAAKKAAEEAAKKAQQAMKDKLVNIQTTQRAPYSATPEEIHLLACIVYWESGWEPAEGQLAVANVVLNRVLSPRFKPKTIERVIYAQGQFSGVVVNGEVSDKFKAVLAMTDEQLNKRGCYDAALLALSGVNNIGDLDFFIQTRKADFTKFTKYTIINNHCFYTYNR